MVGAYHEDSSAAGGQADNSAQQAGADTVFSLHVDRSGDLWVGTEAGLDRFHRPTRTFERIDLGGEDPINAILEDRRGALWIGTSGGLTRYLSSSTPPQVVLQADHGLVDHRAREPHLSGRRSESTLFHHLGKRPHAVESVHVWHPIIVAIPAT